MSDILFRKDGYVFSYRVAGVCVHNGCVLLQKPTNDTGYAFPGGHAALGETNAETLEREFEEEIGAQATVGDLQWVGEIFFPWGDTPCHQICLYYLVSLDLSGIPDHGMFTAKEHIEGRDFDIEFFWIPLAQIPSLTIYPENAKALLPLLGQGVQHFLYKE